MAVIRIDEPRSSQNGFALFDLGFRPFFLAAALFAVLLPVVWIFVLMGYLSLPAYYGEVGWHAHEMLFAYAAAVVAGFLLTAASNWVGSPILKGKPLAALLGLWVLARLLPLVAFVPPWCVALVDVLFLPVLALCLLRPIFKIKQWRNIAFPILVFVMAVGNALVHAEALAISEGTAATGLTIGLYVVLFVIALMAGRVVPFFVERGAEGAKTRKWKLVEVLSLLSVGLLGLSEIFAPGSTLSLWLAIIAACAHSVRWFGWLSLAAFRVSLLWVLLGGYFWFVLGLVLLVVAGLTEVPKSLAIHAFTAGGIGVLTLGMMARVSLGHTGRLLKVSALITWAFALINAAVAIRVFLPMFNVLAYEAVLAVATSLWVLAFTLFLVIYTPILIRPRVDSQR